MNHTYPLTHLVQGVKIYTKESTDQRVQISNGTQEVHSLNGEPCPDNSFTPVFKWRIPSKEEAQLLFATSKEKSNYQTIGVVKLPPSIITPLKAMDIQNATSQQELLALQTHPLFGKTIENIHAFCKEYQIVAEDQHILSLRFAPPRLETTTYDYRANCFVGLHVDDWDNDAPHVRNVSRNRICFNFGKKDRFFLFVNLQLMDILRYIDEDIDNATTINHHEMVTQFLRENPDYPVVKIKVSPFEAYIAPTENIIHDGCCATTEVPDINYTMRAYYQVTPKTWFQKNIAPYFSK
jgi:hypothetical protein